jgi:hypothetical protein
MLAAALLATGCSGPDSASAAEGDEKPAPVKTTQKSQKSEKANRAATSDQRTRTDPPPPDWVRATCTTCSCRVFTGDDPYCKRPSCRHHWSDHKNRLTG